MNKFKASLIALCMFITFNVVNAQELKVKINIEEKFQTIDGFGAALAYYENWLTAHPNKAEIYENIFNDLSLDILRFRNAHDYDAGMIGRVKEFIDASEKYRGNQIPFLTTSWGPPAYLKSNNDRNNGGTLKYTLNNGKVEFDYEGFAKWWSKSLDAYNAKGLYPTYLSIQNEPDFKATYESCLLNPFEKINSTDTLAGYNKALEAVYNKVSTRNNAPKLIGPECIGIGYNSVKNYMLQIDTSLIDGIAHHLYHGVDVTNPWSNIEMQKTGALYPTMKYYQTEYSTKECDWFNLSGLMYKALADENAVAYFYWDLIWDNGGLISLDNPWTSSSWKNSKGFEKTKYYYAFKQFSAFIHPNWQRVSVNVASSEVNAVGFMSPAQDSLSVVVINHSTYADKNLRFEIPGFEFSQFAMYVTSDDYNCKLETELKDPTYSAQFHSINTAFFTKTFKTEIDKQALQTKVYPNPASNFVHIENKQVNSEWKLFTSDGRIIQTGKQSRIDFTSLKQGLYLLKVEGQTHKVIIK